MSKFNNPLDNIRVASPCNADWDEMFGDERKRHCGACSKNVYNLSNLTRLEAENLLLNSEGRLCVRYFRRADGTVLTQDCPVGWQAVKKRVSRVAAAAVSMVAAIFTGVFAFDGLQRLSFSEVGNVQVLDEPTTGVVLPEVVGVVVGEVEDNDGSYVLGMPDFPRRSMKVKEIKPLKQRRR